MHHVEARVPARTVNFVFSSAWQKIEDHQVQRGEQGCHIVILRKDYMPEKEDESELKTVSRDDQNTINEWTEWNE